MINELNLTVPQMLVVITLLLAALTLLALHKSHFKQDLKATEEEHTNNRDAIVMSRYGAYMSIQHH